VQGGRRQRRGGERRGWVGVSSVLFLSRSAAEGPITASARAQLETLLRAFFLPRRMYSCEPRKCACLRSSVQSSEPAECVAPDAWDKSAGHVRLFCFQ
jgi:hypothetical protein